METQLDAAFGHEKNTPNKVWFTQPMGEGKVKDITWREGMDEARRMAAYLRSLDYPPGSRIAIFSKNCAWWILADLAVWMSGHVSVPVYPTLAPDSIRQILEHSGARLVFVGKLDGYPSMAPGIPASVTKVALPLSPETDAQTWSAIVAKTAPLEGLPRREPDDLATIIYTSGSTGVPKGVMHSFRTMSAARVFTDVFGADPNARIISYLPLAHVAERACLEIPNLFVGFHVFFAESLDTFIADVQRARPTVFGSVPRLWLKFQGGVFEKMPPKKLDRLLSIPIVGGVVRKKILRGLGLDQVKFAVCGSAPVPAALLTWYERLGLKIQELYAMTENFAISHMTTEQGRRIGTVGTPVKGVQAKLTDEGEILVKSPGMMLGYYNAPELTREIVDDEGWLHTGDRGALDDAGQLRITGRVKEIFKTSKGKYVAPAPIENALLADSHVEQACVVGAGMPQPIALVVLSPTGRAEARDNIERALTDLRSHVNRGHDPHEHLSSIIVMHEEWTIDNGLLTPTLKLRRAAIEERYGASFSTWSEGATSVTWTKNA